MNILLFTVSLLMMLSILTYSRLNAFLDNHICNKMFLDHSLAQKESQNHRESEIYTMKVLTREPRKPKGNVKAEVPPREKGQQPTLSKQRSTALLTLQARLPFQFEAEATKDPHALTYYELAARLMRQLYDNQSFFHALPKMEYRILDALRQAYQEQKETKHGFQGPPALSEHLGSFVLHDAVLQQAWQKMLIGYKDQKNGYPSLLDYMTVKSADERINLPFAREEVLNALFENPELVRRLIEDRNYLLRVYIGQEKSDEYQPTKADIQKALQKKVHDLVIETGLADSTYDRFLDFDLKYNIKFHTKHENAHSSPQPE